MLHGNSDASFRNWVSSQFFVSVYKKVIELLFNLTIYEVCLILNNQPNLLLSLQFLPPQPQPKRRRKKNCDGPIIFKRPYAIVKRFEVEEYYKFWNPYQRKRVIPFEDPPSLKHLIITGILYGLWSRKLKLTAEYYYNATLHWEFFVDAVKRYAFVKRCSNPFKMISDESYRIAQLAAESSFTFVKEPTQGNKLLMVNTNEASNNQELLAPFLKLKRALENDDNNDDDNDKEPQAIKSGLIFDYLSKLKMQYTKHGFLKCIIPARKELIHSIRLEARGEHDKLINDWESLICFQRCYRRDCLTQQIWNLPEPAFAILPPWVFMTCKNRDEYWQLMFSTVKAEKSRLETEKKKTVKKGKRHRKESFIVEPTNAPTLQNCLVCFIFRLLEVPEWKTYLSVFFGAWWSEADDPDLSKLLGGVHLCYCREVDGIAGQRLVYEISHNKWPEVGTIVDYHGD